MFAFMSNIVTIAQGKSPLTVEQIMYEIKYPVKSLRCWQASEEDIASNPQIKFNDYKAVERAIDNGVLDEMTCSVSKIDIEPSKDGIDIDYGCLTGQWEKPGFRLGLPGMFQVYLEDGKPVKYVLDEGKFQEAVDNGMMYLDAYEIGLENFNITYDSNGFAKKLTGIKMPYFNGGHYTEEYSNYKFDSHGNWVKRTVSTPYKNYIQYRSYEY